MKRNDIMNDFFFSLIDGVAYSKTVWAVRGERKKKKTYTVKKSRLLLYCIRRGFYTCIIIIIIIIFFIFLRPVDGVRVKRTRG